MGNEKINLALARAFFRIELLVEGLKDPDHAGSCPVDDDTGHGSCNCEAGDQSNAIRRIKVEIKRVNDLPMK